jgi:hypothetical protein
METPGNKKVFKFGLDISNVRERKEEIIKQLEDIENEILKVAGEEIVGGALFAPAHNSAHVSGGWQKSS